jgi:membrane associated rhomboid family serine protease
MDKFAIIAGLLLATILFIVLKVIGMVVKFALVAAVLGFVAGLLLARALRR